MSVLFHYKILGQSKLSGATEEVIHEKEFTLDSGFWDLDLFFGYGSLR